MAWLLEPAIGVAKKELLDAYPEIVSVIWRDRSMVTKTTTTYGFCFYFCYPCSRITAAPHRPRQAGRLPRPGRISERYSSIRRLHGSKQAIGSSWPRRDEPLWALTRFWGRGNGPRTAAQRIVGHLSPSSWWWHSDGYCILRFAMAREMMFTSVTACRMQCQGAAADAHI